METYAIIETTTTLDKVKDLVSKMNDFEFRYDTNDNRIAYQEYKKRSTVSVMKVARIGKKLISIYKTISKY